MIFTQKATKSLPQDVQISSLELHLQGKETKAKKTSLDLRQNQPSLTTTLRRRRRRRKVEKVNLWMMIALCKWRQLPGESMMSCRTISIPSRWILSFHRHPCIFRGYFDKSRESIGQTPTLGNCQKLFLAELTWKFHPRHFTLWRNKLPKYKATRLSPKPSRIWRVNWVDSAAPSILWFQLNHSKEQ